METIEQNNEIIKSRKIKKEEQYFLRDKTCINKIIEMIDLDKSDIITELGSGNGSVAEHLRGFKKMILVEKDRKLAQELKKKFEGNIRINVINTDAIQYIRSQPTNKILSNLPSKLTKKVFTSLKRIKFEFALVIIKEGEDLERYKKWFNIQYITQFNTTCFKPWQPFNSWLIKVSKKQGK